ncbi:lipolytic enzyme [Spiroplasma sp. TIUS-1]|uniref:SGNH/GDSL hydrolase family protein n=1 Tax=Spiroplasma sp. TIUS-1 TaxID=216963 RepID=UPI001397B50C|nr:SGNH/GDSL hydrolase family protein [Spiroplasma sp. TIUS-1]QHX36241.1 lipolytic enzyme [Spiroplasma sp. TIUS-1]
MKKLISILTSSVLVMSTSILLVSCIAQGAKPSPLTIGNEIKKVDGAANYKNGTNHPNKDSKFTNYFIIGDSLSDVDGLSKMLNEKTKFDISGLNVDFSSLSPLMPVPNKVLNIKTDINLSLGNDEIGDEGYGFKSKDGKWHSSFSNGETAGYLLNEKLGFGEMESSNPFSKGTIKKNNRNYSIGGATASNALNTTSSLILDDVTVDKQARALISQHHVEQTNNDLVFFEIGGNDLFALGGLDPNDTKTQNKVIEESMQKIRLTLFTLLNNGIENIIVGTPPDVSTVPRYGNANDKTLKYLAKTSARYHSEMLKVIEEVQKYYPNQIQIYDIYEEFEGLKDRHEIEYNKDKSKEEFVTTNKDKAFTDSMKFKGNGEIELTAKTIVTTTKIKLLTFDSEKGGLIITKPSVPELLAFGLAKTIDVSLSANMAMIPFRNQDGVEKPIDIDSYFFTDIVHPTRLVHKLVSEDLFELSKKFEN